MSYRVIFREDGSAFMTLEVGDPILMNIVVSTMLVKGQWWKEPDWGRRPHRTIVHANIEAEARAAYEEALKWLIDTGRASKVQVSARVIGYGKLSIGISVTKPDGGVVPYNAYDIFQEVI